MDVNEMKIDLMSISGHKLYGPKGVGALYARRRPRVRIEPLQTGGGQEVIGFRILMKKIIHLRFRSCFTDLCKSLSYSKSIKPNNQYIRNHEYVILYSYVTMTYKSYLFSPCSQRGIRSGTVPAPLAIGLGAACEICNNDMEFDSQHITALSHRLYNKITAKLDGVIRNGHPTATYPGKICCNYLNYLHLLVLPAQKTS